MRRDADTLTCFSELMRLGHLSEHGRALARHVQGVHDAVGGIRADDQLYTLATLILGPSQLAAAVGTRRPTAAEDTARWTFWSAIGRAMGLPGIPSGIADLREWAEEYERANVEHHPICHAAAEAHVRGLGRRFPGPALGLARRVVITALGARTATCLGYRPPSRASGALLRGVTAAATAAGHLRRVRLDNTWARAFQR